MEFGGHLLDFNSNKNIKITGSSALKKSVLWSFLLCLKKELSIGTLVKYHTIHMHTFLV